MKHKLLILIICIASVCFFVSCKKETQQYLPKSTGVASKTVLSTEPEALELQTQTWHISNEVICILFGYGYNNSEFVKLTKSELYKKYGAAEDGGLILPLVFPDDFKRGSRSIAAELPLYVKDKKLRGVILLGAPENTHFGIAHLQDNYDGKPDFAVFAFFPQDDVAGIEGTADIIIDKAQEANIDGIVEAETTQTFEKVVPDLIRKSITFMLAVDAPLPKRQDMSIYLKSIIGKLKINKYIDPQTNLQSINRFVLNE